jgi:hypothetical protein
MVSSDGYIIPRITLLSDTYVKDYPKFSKRPLQPPVTGKAPPPVVKTQPSSFIHPRRNSTSSVEAVHMNSFKEYASDPRNSVKFA